MYIVIGIFCILINAAAGWILANRVVESEHCSRLKQTVVAAILLQYMATTIGITHFM